MPRYQNQSALACAQTHSPAPSHIPHDRRCTRRDNHRRHHSPQNRYCQSGPPIGRTRPVASSDRRCQPPPQSLRPRSRESTAASTRTASLIRREFSNRPDSPPLPAPSPATHFLLASASPPPRAPTPLHFHNVRSALLS